MKRKREKRERERERERREREREERDGEKGGGGKGDVQMDNIRYCSNIELGKQTNERIINERDKRFPVVY